MIQYLLFSALAVFLYMTLLFAISMAKKDNSIADIGWGVGFVLVSFLTLFLERGFEIRHVLVTGLVLIWGIRLAVHILMRNKGKGEDFRYAKWRKEWGKYFVLRSYLQVFMLQGLLMLVVSYEIILVNSSVKSGLNILDILGVMVWLFGFLFETVGDFQLLKFKRDKNNRGKIMTSGLWRYTRHPNYFGEATMWWGLFLIALSVAHGWTALISPLVITVMLLRVSGVTLLEKKYKGNKEFEEYAKRTSSFIPWFPKKNQSP
jgi:steroid 5-alpha reductase family enzyme